MFSPTGFLFNCFPRGQLLNVNRYTWKLEHISWIYYIYIILSLRKIKPENPLLTINTCYIKDLLYTSENPHGPFLKSLFPLPAGVGLCKVNHFSCLVDVKSMMTFDSVSML